jgi:hypothetical protein
MDDESLQYVKGSRSSKRKESLMAIHNFDMLFYVVFT